MSPFIQKNSVKYLKISVVIVTLFVSCNKGKKFELLPSSETGITFNNRITETKDINPLKHMYIYNGAGVGAGDINNDGLPDLFFAGNMADSKVYLNKGKLRFEDITDKAGIIGGVWATGVNFIDINTDGLMDIYVCVADNTSKKPENQLYINQGNNTFKEMAAAFGLNDPGYSTQSIFLDYDKDGDLDMYLLTNGIETTLHQNNTRPRKLDGTGISTDRLYRNNGDNTFTNVSTEAGITIEGYGLGVGVLDVNSDGWPDIYCSNDFITNDLLWVNNRDGTFIESIRDYITQTSHNGMGIDIADYNNDGLMDIVEVDMLPETNLHNKTMTPAMNYNNQTMRFSFDYMPQYVRNTLQLRNKNASFSEIGRLANIDKTDWSWAPLLADLDNDGKKDLFISNGYGKDITDLDYIVYSEVAQNPFGSNEVREKNQLKELGKLPAIDLPNYFYRNTGDLTMKNVTDTWSSSENSMSNGAIYADLDRDGDLDLVTNNINKEAFLYENKSVDNDPEKANYLNVLLQGGPKNPNGIGAEVSLYGGGSVQRLVQQPVHGYLSSVSYELHFGLGEHRSVDSLSVKWPDGKQQRIVDIAVNKSVQLTYNNAKEHKGQAKKQGLQLLTENFRSVQELVHKENAYIDFQNQPLLLKMLSREGPGMATADLDKDGTDEVVLTTAVHDTTYVWTKKRDIGFVKGQALPNSWQYEQLGCLIFDADSDGLPDIYITSGGNELPYDLHSYQDQLYIQQKDGSFSVSDGLPEIRSSTSTVNAGDFDGDGDLDLFIGSRLKPESYPYPDKSFLLRNDNGVFRDVTSEVAPELEHVGLVTSALWTDFNNDAQIDLIVVGEWMEITFFENNDGRLKNVTPATGLEGLSGFWNSIDGADFDADGDIDYIVGNLGMNSALTASEEEPITIMAKDFDNNGQVDPILGYYLQGKNYPFASRDALVSQIPAMKKRFPFYRDYGNATFDRLFKKEETAGALEKKVTMLNTVYLENKGNGDFSYKNLPLQAQMAPTYGLAIDDFDKDGEYDLLLSGNRRDSESLGGYLDGSIGTMLLGDGKGSFRVEDVAKSGYFTPGDARGILKIVDKDSISYLVANNNQRAQNFQRANTDRTIDIGQGDRYALIKLKTGKTRKIEFYYGSGYLTQDSRKLVVSEDATDVYIVNGLNEKRSVL